MTQPETKAAPSPQTEGETEVFDDTKAAALAPLAYSQEDADTVDYPLAWRQRTPWRPVWVRAAGVLAVAGAVAVGIVAAWTVNVERPAPPALPVDGGAASLSVAPTPSAAPSAPPAPPPPTVTVTETPAPPVHTETPPPPPPRATAAAPTPGQDQLYLSLISQIPGTVITDPATAVAGGRQICPGLSREGRAAIEAAVQANDPGFARWQASAVVDAAITAYCPG